MHHSHSLNPRPDLSNSTAWEKSSPSNRVRNLLRSLAKLVLMKVRLDKVASSDPKCKLHLLPFNHPQGLIPTVTRLATGSVGIKEMPLFTPIHFCFLLVHHRYPKPLSLSAISCSSSSLRGPLVSSREETTFTACTFWLSVTSLGKTSSSTFPSISSNNGKP